MGEGVGGCLGFYLITVFFFLLFLGFFGVCLSSLVSSAFGRGVVRCGACTTKIISVPIPFDVGEVGAKEGIQVADDFRGRLSVLAGEG